MKMYTKGKCEDNTRFLTLFKQYSLSVCLRHSYTSIINNNGVSYKDERRKPLFVW